MTDQEKTAVVEDQVAEDDFEVEVVDDPVSEKDKEAADPSADTADDSDELTEEEKSSLGERTRRRIDKLVWQRHEERRRREAAERKAAEALQAAQTMHSRMEEMQSYVGISAKELNSQVSERAKMGVDAARRALQDAHESGDTAKIAEAQSELTKAQIFASQPEAVQRRIITEWQKNRKPQVAKPREDQGADSVEIPEPDPQAVEWRTRNPWFGNDPEMTSFAYGVHEKLVRSGMDPTSQEYYDRLDARIRAVFPGTASQDAGGTPPRKPSPALVVAPSTRSSGGAPKKVRLTKSQVDIAERLGIPLKVYAAEYAKSQAAESES